MKQLAFSRQITKYVQFIGVDSAKILDAWVVSHPMTNEMWYNKLGKLPKDESLLENLEAASDGFLDVECLLMSKISKLDPKLSIRIGNCKEKHSVICRAEIQKINSLKETSKFPCLETSSKGRAKRSPKEENHGKGENDTGKYFNIFSRKKVKQEIRL